jgi:phage shock protein PspC (stress-responsive transcriptional regulator)
MTETPKPPTDEQPVGGGTTTAEPGVDRQHLRNYEGLRRSTTDRKIAGVAGGLGRHLNIDPTVLRVMFVVLTLFSGAGLVLYAAAWLLVPEEGSNRSAMHVDDSTRNIVLIVVGAVAALIVVGNSWHGGFGFPWPLLLIGILVFAWLANRERGSHPSGPSSASGSAPGGPTYSTTYPTQGTTTTSESAGFAYPTDQAQGQGGGTQAPPAPPWAPAGGLAYQPYQPPPRPAKRGPKLFGFTLAALLVALGTLGLFDVAGADVVPTAYPALALAVVGAMLVVGAFVGRAGGLIALGLVASLVLAGTAIAGFTGDGDNLRVHPRSALAVHDSYSIKAGRAYVDLSDVRDPQALDGRSIDVGGRVGEIVLVLPQGVSSTVDASISGPGGIDLPDDSRGGMGTSTTRSYGTQSQHVTFQVHLKAGHIDVRNP